MVRCRHAAAGYLSWRQLTVRQRACVVSMHRTKVKFCACFFSVCICACFCKVVVRFTLCFFYVLYVFCFLFRHCFTLVGEPKSVSLIDVISFFSSSSFLHQITLATLCYVVSGRVSYARCLRPGLSFPHSKKRVFFLCSCCGKIGYGLAHRLGRLGRGGVREGRGRYDGGGSFSVGLVWCPSWGSSSLRAWFAVSFSCLCFSGVSCASVSRAAPSVAFFFYVVGADR